MTKMKYDIKSIEPESCWQVSDTVNPELVRLMINQCDDKLCKLSFHYMGGTMLGYSTWYNSLGIFQKTDCNTSKYKVTCYKCWKSWSIDQHPVYDKE